MGVTTADGDAAKTATKQEDVKPEGDSAADQDAKDSETLAKQQTKPKRSSLGMFRGAAISVLSKVIETKEEECDNTQVKEAEGSKDCVKTTRSVSLEASELRKTRDVPPSVKARRRSSDLGVIEQVIQNVRRQKSISDPNDVGRRPSLSSIAGLVTLRKMHMAKNQHSKDGQPAGRAKLDLSEIKPEEMPEAPRFGATLSQEAQYATLSCYGDKVLNYLKECGHSAWSRTSDRTQTPPDTTRLLMEGEEPDAEKTTAASAAAASAAAGVLPSIDHPARRQRAAATRTGRDATSKLPKAKDLKVTHRLEYVMDILDKVKSSEGGITTTPRMRLKNMDPIQHAESWLLSWDTEFTVKDKEPE